MTDDELTGKILGACFKVHTVLGIGLMERVYQVALAYELRKQGLTVEMEVPVPVHYEGVKLEVGFRLDMLVERRVILELKAVDAIHPAHKKQLTNYLRLTGLRVGLLLNFNTVSLKDQITRIVNGYEQKTL